MNKEKFERLMRKAGTLRRLGDRPDYWVGFMRGLRRAYHGNRFGTYAEHQVWLGLVYDPVRAEFGKGYRQGLKAGGVTTLLRNLLTGEEIEVQATTESSTSSYGAECWVDESGTSYGQCDFPPFGFEIVERRKDDEPERQ